jgi:hypothetical protein
MTSCVRLPGVTRAVILWRIMSAVTGCCASVMLWTSSKPLVFAQAAIRSADSAATLRGVSPPPVLLTPMHTAARRMGRRPSPSFWRIGPRLSIPDLRKEIASVASRDELLAMK